MGKGLPRSHARMTHGRFGKVQLIIPVRSLPVVITDPGAAAGWGTAIIAGLPVGDILFNGMKAELTITKDDVDMIDAFDGDIAFGTAPTADNTLAGAEVDLIASTAIAQGVSGVSANNRAISTPTEHGVMIDNTGGTLEINLQVLLDDASLNADAAVLVDGVVYFDATYMGT